MSKLTTVLGFSAGLISAVSLAAAADMSAQGPTFRADYIGGKSLDGWKSLGQASWSVKDGQVVADTKKGGGWLVLDQSLANVGFFTDVKCSAECAAGVLFRAEKTPDGGMKGVYVDFGTKDRGSFAVTLDAQGRELSRTKLESKESDGGLANIMGNYRENKGLVDLIGGGGKIQVQKPTTADVPPGLVSAPTGLYRAKEWNSVEVYLYAEALKPNLNRRSIVGQQGELVPSIAPEDAGRFGPIALYAGGKGTVTLRNLAYSDLNVKPVPVETVSKNYEMRRLDSYFFSYGTAIGDINRDGHPDLIAGARWYEGPDFTKAHEIFPLPPYNPGKDYPQQSFIPFVYDFTGDGWPDVLLTTGNVVSQVYLYVNPAGQSRHWEKHHVVENIGNEETLLRDIDGDGKPELIHASKLAMAYSKPDPSDPRKPWITTPITEEGPWGNYAGHGLGIGDVNGDGRVDMVSAFGWWEQPAQPGMWVYHAAQFGRWGSSQGGPGGAQVGVYDVNGDGLTDIVSALEGHGFGISWFEQKRDAKGTITFVEHPIMGDFVSDKTPASVFTEPHGITFADMNGDGVQDLIVGKRAMSHLFNYGDPDTFGAPVLVVFYAKRNAAAPGGAEFERELVHNFSGVGAHLVAEDVDGDGRPDIATSGALGTFLFFNRVPPKH